MLNYATKIAFFLIKLKKFSFPFAFVFKNSYIANRFETLTNHKELESMMMQVKTVVNDDDYLFFYWLSLPYLKQK